MISAWYHHEAVALQIETALVATVLDTAVAAMRMMVVALVFAVTAIKILLQRSDVHLL
jgi:PPE-repeat protein